MTASQPFFILLLFQGEPRVAPGAYAADEDVYVREVVLFERQRRTGAGVLVVSGAVGDQGAAARHLAYPLFKLAAPDAEAARNLLVALRPVARVARVDEDGAAPLLDQPPRLARRDPPRPKIGRAHV